MVAFLGVNVGVLAVATVLGSAEVGVGLGLGLFGVLSIIRLRSSEISQTEVAYYFAALALGLLAGLSATINPLVIALMALAVVVLFIGDDPRLFKQYRQQTVQLDTAYSDETKLRLELERMLGATVHKVTVQHLDLVNDTTLVDVRYQITRKPPTEAHFMKARHEELVGTQLTRSNPSASTGSCRLPPCRRGSTANASCRPIKKRPSLKIWMRRREFFRSTGSAHPTMNPSISIPPSC